MKKLWVLILGILTLACLAVFIFRGELINKFAAKAILKEGQAMVFGDYTVFIEKINENKLSGIKISGKNRKLEAKSGDYSYFADENVLKFNLQDGVAEDADPDNPQAFRRLTFKQISMKIKLKGSGLKEGGELSGISF
jgi:hypothetical protein